jgi:hypothetical protein
VLQITVLFESSDLGEIVKLSLKRVRATRDDADLVGKSFRLHPDIVEAFEKKATEEGLKHVQLLEKTVIFYINHGGTDTKIP